MAKLIAAAVLISLIYVGINAAWDAAFQSGVDSERVAWQADVAAKIEDARKIEQDRQEKINDLLQKQYDELAGINGALLDDLNSLRDRPDRPDEPSVPDDSRTSCEGADGRDLSGPDARFLVGLAARADTLRTGLAACYDYADAIMH